MEHVRRVCAREPENYRAHLIMGNVLLAQGRYNEAMLRFKAASDLDPEAVSPLYYMAMASELSGKTEDVPEALQAIAGEESEAGGCRRGMQIC